MPQELVVDSTRDTLLLFYSPWCDACVLLTRTLPRIQALELTDFSLISQSDITTPLNFIVWRAQLSLVLVSMSETPLCETQVRILQGAAARVGPRGRRTHRRRCTGHCGAL